MAGLLSSLRAFTRVSQPWAFQQLHTAASPSRLARLAPFPPFRAQPPRLTLAPTLFASSSSQLFHTSSPALVTLNQAVRRKHHKRPKRPTSPLLESHPQKKGVISSVFVAKPKKPNSARRKVARVKLTNGNTVQAYIMGEGHNLQEHSVVLVRGGRAQDLPGVRYKLVRGTLDLGGVPNRMTARSRYGAKKPKQ